MKQELERRESIADRLERYFRDHPGEVVQHLELKRVAGDNYRSRIAELRKKRKLFIKHIDQQKADGSATYGAYQFWPHPPIGEDVAVKPRPARPVTLFPLR